MKCRKFVFGCEEREVDARQWTRNWLMRQGACIAKSWAMIVAGVSDLIPLEFIQRL